MGIQSLRARTLGMMAAIALMSGCFKAEDLKAFFGGGLLAFSSATYSVAEPGAGTTDVTITVVRIGGNEGAVTVDYATSNGSATEPGDYGAESGTLGWADGDSTPQTFTITVDSDAFVEGDETINVALSLPTGGSALGTPSAAVVTITDEDAPAEGVLQFSQAVYAVDETVGTVTITVTRTGGSTGAVSVEALVSDGSATDPADYASPTPTNPVVLTWADGDSAPKTFTIGIVADGTPDGAPVEDIDLTLQNEAAVPPNTNAPALGTLDVATVEITDNDVGGSVEFDSATYMVSESGGTATLTVVRSGGSQGPASVEVVDDGTGSATGGGTDYTFSTTTLNWANGETGPKTATVTIDDDNIVEGDEDVDFSLQNESGAVLGGQTTAVLTIVDDDSVGMVQFVSAAYNVAEGDGSVTLVVTRVGGDSGAAQVDVVDITTPGGSSATEGSDYTYPTTQTVMWADDELGPKNVVIPITDDMDVEGDEDAVFELQNEMVATLGAPTTTTVTIADNDAPGTIEFTAAAFQIDEDDASGQAIITVTRTGGSGGTASVNVNDITTPGPGAATNGADYTFSTPHTETWNPGESGPRDIVIPITNDMVSEGNEVANFDLDTFVGAGMGAQLTADLTIVDDDAPASGDVQFAVTNVYTVAESGTSITINVSRVGGSSGMITVDFATSDGTAEALSGMGSPFQWDYISNSGTLIWNDTDVADKPITITILDNDFAQTIDAAMETFDITLSNPTGGASILGTNPETVTINDDN